MKTVQPDPEAEGSPLSTENADGGDGAVAQTAGGWREVAGADEVGETEASSPDAPDTGTVSETRTARTRHSWDDGLIARRASRIVGTYENSAPPGSPGAYSDEGTDEAHPQNDADREASDSTQSAMAVGSAASTAGVPVGQAGTSACQGSALEEEEPGVTPAGAESVVPMWRDGFGGGGANAPAEAPLSNEADEGAVGAAGQGVGAHARAGARDGAFTDSGASALGNDPARGVDRVRGGDFVRGGAGHGCGAPVGGGFAVDDSDGFDAYALAWAVSPEGGGQAGHDFDSLAYGRDGGAYGRSSRNSVAYGWGGGAGGDARGGQGAGVLRSRLDALRELVRLSRSRLDGRALAEAGRVLDEAAARDRYSHGHTVVALAGSTGSGKSTLFNALVGAPLAEAGIQRPTTSAPLACSWTDYADGLLDRLGIPPADRHRPARPYDPVLAGLVLLDLPDHDSVSVGHRARVDRLLGLVDAVVWVVDPEKYADAVLHERYLRPLAGHAEVTVIALNQIDRLPGDAADQVLDDLRRLLDEDGLALGEHGEPGATVLALSALTGEGVGELRETLGHFATECAAAELRLTADVDGATARLRPSYMAEGRTGLSERACEDFEDRLADAAGAVALGQAAERAWLREAARACGTPWSRLSERRADGALFGRTLFRSGWSWPALSNLAAVRVGRPYAGADWAGWGGAAGAGGMAAVGVPAAAERPAPLFSAAGSGGLSVAARAEAAAAGAAAAGGAAGGAAESRRAGWTEVGEPAMRAGLGVPVAGARWMRRVALTERAGNTERMGSAERAGGVTWADECPADAADPAVGQRSARPVGSDVAPFGRPLADATPGAARAVDTPLMDAVSDKPPLGGGPLAKMCRSGASAQGAPSVPVVRSGPALPEVPRGRADGPPVGRPARPAVAASQTVARPAVEQAVRAMAEDAATGLPGPWAQAVREVAQTTAAGLAEALDEVVEEVAHRMAKAPGRAGALSRRPRWWSVATAAQGASLVGQVIGVLWLLSAVTGLASGSWWAPAVLLLSAWVMGPALVWLCGLAARGPARNYGREAERRLRYEVAACGRERVLEAVLAELVRYRQVRERYVVASGGV